MREEQSELLGHTLVPIHSKTRIVGPVEERELITSRADVFAAATSTELFSVPTAKGTLSTTESTSGVPAAPPVGETPLPPPQLPCPVLSPARLSTSFESSC
ncbi:hypothetical protein Q4I28_003506 [Leishmania naiffi]|uniref:Uncharacterized protein n=1 Tax=Leishmania naiffi TaxID=5678 RepID=A0AAW3BVY5_9TRYP